MRGRRRYDAATTPRAIEAARAIPTLGISEVEFPLVRGGQRGWEKRRNGVVVVLAWGCLWKTQHSWWGDAASTAISESAKQNSDLQQLDNVM
jgi:hypothetical protein